MGKTLKEKVFEYLLNNPINDVEKNKYKTFMNHFGFNLKTASKYWVDFKSNGRIPKFNESKKDIKKVITQDKTGLNVTVNTYTEVKTLEDLLAVCEVDTREWKIESWQCKKWDLGIKNSTNSIETKQLYSVSAKFKPISFNDNFSAQRDIILKELYANAPDHSIINNKYKSKAISEGSESKKERNLLLELAIPDIHFGKLAHAEESGEDYDLKIATTRFKTAVYELLGRVNLNNVERILFPIGNDIFNVDGKHNSTTAGTPQDCDTRFYKIVRTVKNVIIEVLNDLVQIAPIDVIIIPGNHDEQTSFMLGEMLDAYYHNTSHVNILNNGSLRKYYKYGITGFMFTHGDKEKHTELGMIFAAENPILWATTTQRYIQLGHLHHNSKINYLSTKEYTGFEVQVIPSISSNDAWHTGKGYLPLKQAKAFLFDAYEGKIGEFTYTVQ